MSATPTIIHDESALARIDLATSAVSANGEDW
jgi:hypothetical protein